MKDYTPKLKRLAQQPAWKRISFVLLVNTLLVWGHVVDFFYYLNFHFPRRPFFFRRHPRAHYIGTHFQKPHRAGFHMLTAALVATPFVIPSQLHLYWAMGWGSVFSIYVIALSFRRICKYNQPNQHMTQATEDQI
jgi:hypothetical protein